MNKKFGILEKIASDIGHYCVRYGRIPVRQTKEKYGTVRVYCGFGIYNLHSLLFPHYHYKHHKYPNWLWTLDIYYIEKFFRLFDKIVIPYQQWIYKRAYLKALRTYPIFYDEIISGMDHQELLDIYIPRLCIEHSNCKKSCYLATENCDACKLGLSVEDIDASHW